MRLGRLIEVTPGPFGGSLAFLHGPHLAARHFRDDGQTDGAAAGAQVDHTGMVSAVAGDPIDAFLHDQLGFRPWDEHTGTDLQVEIAERRMAGDVLQRFAPGTTVDHRVECFERFHGILGQSEKPIAQQHGFVHALQINAECLRAQQFRIMFGCIHTCGAQHGRGTADDGRHGLVSGRPRRCGEGLRHVSHSNPYF